MDNLLGNEWWGRKLHLGMDYQANKKLLKIPVKVLFGPKILDFTYWTHNCGLPMEYWKVKNQCFKGWSKAL